MRNLDHTPTPTAGAIALPSIPDPPSAVVPPSTAGGAGELGGGDEHRSVPALVQVALRGELDIDSAPRVRSELAAAVESGAPTVLVDLHDVTFMDSSGLSALVAAGQALAARVHRCTSKGPAARCARCWRSPPCWTATGSRRPRPRPPPERAGAVSAGPGSGRPTTHRPGVAPR
ncbi:MAG: STAS domain-containing protein [Acidimicrobiales bacterium]